MSKITIKKIDNESYYIPDGTVISKDEYPGIYNAIENWYNSLPGDNLIYPVGALVQYISSPTNKDLILCDGHELKETEYPELFGTVGYNYGKGKEGYFKVPDLRPAEYYIAARPLSI